MPSLLQDVRFAIRSLRRTPGVTVLAVASLALAIAGNTTVFGLVNALLYRPLPYPAADRLVLFGERETSSPPLFTTAAANFLDWQERATSFEALGAFRGTSVSLGTGDDLEAVPAGEITPALLETLGARPMDGRLFTRDEGLPGSASVVIIGQDFASERFEAGVDPVGEGLVLNGRTHQVIGVLPADFEFLVPNLDLWLPLRLDRAGASRIQRDLFVMGRLADGVAMGAARAEMEAIAAQLVEEYPEANRGFVVDVLNYRHEFPDRWRRQLYFLLLGVVLAVLLVACVNVANLLLARGQARRREIAVRSAIGAGRGRVFRQLLTESLVLAGVGGALGLALGYGGVRAMAAAMGPYLPRFYTPVVDGRVVLFTVVLALVAGVLFGIAPTLTGSRPDLVNVLKEGGRGVGGPSRRWLSRTLVVAEIAVSLVLLGGAAVMVRSFLDFQNADPGYDRTRLVAAPIVLPADVDTPERQVDLLARLKTAVQAMPDVTDAALTTAIPEGIQPASDSFTLDAAPPAPGEAHPRAIWLAVSPEYLATLGVPVRRGRFIEPGDRAGTTPVVVINEAMAERYWPDADPIGERLTLGGTSTTIVGVVGDVRQSFISFGQSAEATLYVPLDQRPAPVVTVLARARTDGQALVPLVRRDLLAAESRLTVGQVQSMTEFVAQFHVGLNLFNVILTGFGLLALVLAAVGTYGVLAYDVAQRGHEIGLRLAMGAPRKRILRMFLRRGATLAAIGLAIGAPGVIAIAVFIRSLLVVFSNVQPIVVVAVAAVLLLTTLAASFVPAWRAMRFDPARVLRQE